MLYSNTSMKLLTVLVTDIYNILNIYEYMNIYIYMQRK